MTKKTDPSDPGPLPGAEKPARTRRIGVPLNDRSADVVRRAAKYTEKSVSWVLDSLAASDELTRFVEKTCRGLAEAHDRDRESVRNKLFPTFKPQPEEGT